VDDVGRGEETVEVQAFHDDLPLILQSFPGCESVKKEGQSYVVKMKDGFHSLELNRFLFEKGIVANHLVTQKKSLEKQFLEILAEADHAALAKH